MTETTQPGPADPSSLPFFTNSSAAPQIPTVEAAAAAGSSVSRAAQRLARTGRDAPAITPAFTDPNEQNQTVMETPKLAVVLSGPSGTDATQEKGTLEERSTLPWEEIEAIHAEVSRELAGVFSEAFGVTEEQRRQTARGHITDRVRARVDEQIRQPGERYWEPRQQGLIIQAVFDRLFRLGRLQPLVDEPGVENIRINGYDNVWLSYADGTKRPYPYPVAANDADLARSINILASQSGEGGRAFTSANPRLRMDISGDARLSAIAATTSVRPAIVIRLHRHIDITLDELVTLETLTRRAADMLGAAVRGGVSIVVSGFAGAGKTTLLRALAQAIPWEENLVIIEKVRELHLDDPVKRPLTFSFEARAGEGEKGPDGRKPGEITLEDLVEDTLTLDTQRFIVGEVLGPEMYAMMTAMQSGVGSLSTIHSASADEAIDRMSALLLSRGQNATPTYAYKMIELNIKLIVQITKITDPRTGEPRRVVTEIGLIQRGEATTGHRPVISQLFRLDPYTATLVPGEVISDRRLDETLILNGYNDAEYGSGR